MKSQLSSIEAAGCCLSADADDEADRPWEPPTGDSPLDHLHNCTRLPYLRCHVRLASSFRQDIVIVLIETLDHATGTLGFPAILCRR